jgi:hypothetical protein
MPERRKYPRTILPQRAQFFGKRGWEDCLITEVSRKGMGVTFYTSETIIPGSIIHVKVRVPQESNPVKVKGVLRWLEHTGAHFVGGIEWFHIDRGTKQETRE